MSQRFILAVPAKFGVNHVAFEATAAAPTLDPKVAHLLESIEILNPDIVAGGGFALFAAAVAFDIPPREHDLAAAAES
jgi:hypothetical protein